MGFMPLASSVLSSESDYINVAETCRKPFSPISPNHNFNPSGKEGRKMRTFSFELSKSANAKKPKPTPHVSLDSSLIQASMISQMPDGIISYEELESLLSQPNLPSFDVKLPESNNPNDPLSIQSSSNLFSDIESVLFSDLDNLQNNEDPFFGDMTNSNLPKNHDNNEKFLFDTPRPKVEKGTAQKMMTMHDLVKAKHQIPRSLEIKVISRNQRPNPITPNFSRRIVAKAIESKDKSREERQQYTNFLKKLCTDELIKEEEEDDDDDEIFDIFSHSNEIESDDSSSNNKKEDVNISPKELFELFNELNEDTAGMLDRDHCIKGELEEHQHQLQLQQQLLDLATFDDDLIKGMERQINIHFQLLIQGLALSGEIMNADTIWVTTLKLMIRLNEQIKNFKIEEENSFHFNGNSGLEILFRILRQSPLHEELLQVISKNNSFDPDLRFRASVDQIPFKLKFKEGKNPIFSKSFWHILSIFGDPFDDEFSLVPKEIQPDSLIDQQHYPNPNPNLNPSQNQSQLIQNNFRRQDSFSTVEDHLLLLGLYRYGTGNWEKIQVNLIPTRTPKQLLTRFKNLSNRRAPNNPVKEFYIEIMKPLSQIEEDLMLEGVKTYGYDWNSISNRFLPNRPPSVLKRLWRKRFINPTKSTILTIEFPSEDESDSDYTFHE